MKTIRHDGGFRLPLKQGRLVEVGALGRAGRTMEMQVSAVQNTEASGKSESAREQGQRVGRPRVLPEAYFLVRPFHRKVI